MPSPNKRLPQRGGGSRSGGSSGYVVREGASERVGGQRYMLCQHVGFATRRPRHTTIVYTWVYTDWEPTRKRTDSSCACSHPLLLSARRAGSCA